MRSVAWLRLGVLAGACVAVGLWLPPRSSSHAPVERITAVQPDASLPQAAVEVLQAPSPRSAGAVSRDPFASNSNPSRPAAGVDNPASARAAQGRFLAYKSPDGAPRRELVVALQRELARIGCYDGLADGSWGAGSRRAMGAFVRRVNAALPVEEPDYVLLALLQNHKSVSCGNATVKLAALEHAPSLTPAPAPKAARANGTPRFANADKRKTRSAASVRPIYTFADRTPWRDRIFASPH